MSPLNSSVRHDAFNFSKWHKNLKGQVWGTAGIQKLTHLFFIIHFTLILVYLSPCFSFIINVSSKMCYCCKLKNIYYLINLGGASVWSRGLNSQHLEPNNTSHCACTSLTMTLKRLLLFKSCISPTTNYTTLIFKWIHWIHHQLRPGWLNTELGQGLFHQNNFSTNLPVWCICVTICNHANVQLCMIVLV